MGSPKHLLLHPASQQPLYLHHLELLRQLEREGVFSRGVFVSARADQRAALELPEVRPFPLVVTLLLSSRTLTAETVQGVACVEDDPDRNGDIGPASGILQASAARPDATWLVLAVDLPFVTRASILHLLSAHAPDSPVSLFLHPSDGNPEPLFSIWTPRALEQLRHNCREGKSGPCRAAKDVWGGKIVEGKGGVKVLEEDSVRDADTPEEWEKALAALARKEVRQHPLPLLDALADFPAEDVAWRRQRIAAHHPSAFAACQASPAIFLCASSLHSLPRRHRANRKASPITCGRCCRASDSPRCHGDE